MKRLFVLFLAVAMVGLFTIPEPAEAKRFGGGKSFGKSFKYSRQAKPPRKSSNDVSKSSPGRQATAGGAAPRRGGLMGPIMGLAAGGILAAMFFGGAFEGFQMFDFLIIGLLAFIGFKLFRAFTGGARRPTYAAAGGAPQEPQQRTAAPQNARTTTFDVPAIGSGLDTQPLSITPEWFSEPSFMAEAESHFREVQKAWDSGDLDSIKSYVTTDMLANITAQQQDLQQSPKTEVVELQSQLLDLLEDDNDIIAAILFSGLIAEDGASAAEFSEVWHVRHPKESQEGDWLIDGIRQYEA
ncbi:MAG TPA: hypothetical protein DD827_00415 [Gammaproteobacteria bacterium]|nr:hypothetical protein [Gammaproteobacteria bacterium]